jgi:small-conductance mechanosensitive channel
MTEFEIQIIETSVLAVVVTAIKLISRNAVNRLLNKIDFDLKRKRITHKIINFFLTIFILIALAAIWNIRREQLIVFMTSVVTVLGIAFFAQWSILSNITASLILFFNHPLKIGHQVRVMDKEYDIEGELIDISFFFIFIRDKNNNMITIPTSVVLQKTIVTKD